MAIDSAGGDEGHPAQDTVTQIGGVLRATNADVVTPPSLGWNPFQELETGERKPRANHPSLQDLDRESIPVGMEGSYFH